MRTLPAALSNPWFEAHFYAGVLTEGQKSYWSHHPSQRPFTFAESQGLMIWCPCGFSLLKEDGTERYPLDGGRPHMVQIPFLNPPCGVPVPSDHGPMGRDGQRPRWTVSGTGLLDLTLMPSVAVGGDTECWHGFIQNGIVRNA